jgi:hypothetical protein
MNCRCIVPHQLQDLIQLVFNDKDNESVVADLASQLSRMPSELTAGLKQHDLQYLLEYWRERRSLGGFRQVYPNPHHHDLHKAFLGTHKVVGPRRMVLHDILHRLASTAPPDAASTTTSTTTENAQQQFAEPPGGELAADQVAVDR